MKIVPVVSNRGELGFNRLLSTLNTLMHGSEILERCFIFDTYNKVPSPPTNLHEAPLFGSRIGPPYSATLRPLAAAIAAFAFGADRRAAKRSLKMLPSSSKQEPPRALETHLHHPLHQRCRGPYG